MKLEEAVKLIPEGKFAVIWLHAKEIDCITLAKSNSMEVKNG